MKKTILIFSLVAISFASCSSDAEINDISANGAVETKSALDKIFTVEKVADDISIAGSSGNIACTDLDGNFYFAEGTDVMKYDLQTKETVKAFKLPEKFEGYVALCVDQQKNLYYKAFDKLFKISGVDGSVADLTSRIPFPTNTTAVVLCGITAAENGNVFLSGYAYQDVPTPLIREHIFKVTPQAVISEFASYVRGDYPYLKGSSLVKSKGSYVYVVDLKEENPDNNRYLKINTTNGQIEDLSAHTPVKAISATHSKDNPYALSGNDIVRIRPTETSDLLIGTIPSYITDENGELVSLGYLGNFWMNAEATVFYVMSHDYGQNKSACYKLTLE
ncbi:hypothetical protein [Dysgonomonas sp. ZJ709]|uniref:hypothetical protein n=1 Tax=Dysgonomonas sp. ZJ709 TaxID=2709797 RepID=UPI0013EDCDD3|nr:hypothetical protein [Dysgonomonas sp. ZJ709]